MKKAFLIAAVTLISVGVSAAGKAPQTSSRTATPPAATATKTSAASPNVAATPASYQEMMNKYCVTCHNQKAKIPAGAPLALDTANLKDPAADAAVWEKVVRKLGVGAMPPQNSPTPGNAELTNFRNSLITALDSAAAKNVNPGKFVLHRLNRTEYGNAIRDLLGVKIDVSELLPSDGGDFGFDNIAAALKTSPLLLERYLTAALQVSDTAIGNTEAAPGTVTFSISTEVSQYQHVEGLPLGTRGGKVVTYDFPADGEYVLYGRLLRTVAEGYVGVEGHETPHQFIITLDGEQVFTASVGGKEDHESSSKNIVISREEVDKRMTSPPIKITAGPHQVGFTFVDRPAQEQNVWQPVLRASLEAHNPSGLPRLRSLNIEGPYKVTGISETPSRQRIFVCHPTTAAKEGPCAAEIFTAIARRAFRRPVVESDTEAPLTFYNDARKNGGDFNAGIRAGIARILASPSFVFRAERDPASMAGGTAHRISDLEMASRLSFFLWSSIPDDELLNLAIAGRLREPRVLEAQVRRMIADDRADALMTEFTGQWLQLRNLNKVTPDLLMFPDFDDNLRQAFRRETELFFASIVRDNRSALDLLSADYTFVNERLARHYGIAGVYGSRFRRVPLTDPKRRGLLGQGSFLALTSVANRTSPIIRGKYVISNLMNVPPLPPPPNVPLLEASAPKDRPSTVREQLELHRSNPVCASCHRTIDPIGFALENFNAIGQWQEKTKDGLTIDSAGTLMDGTTVNGPVELQKAMLARPEVFVGTVTEKLLTYALGRGLEPYDMPVVRKVLRSAAKDNYRLEPIILGIVQSTPFQMRTKLTEPSAAKTIAQTQIKE